MRLDAFDYHLPESLIAQRPLEDRSASRLLVVDRTSAAIDHGVFRDIERLIEPGDVLVVNRSRVIPARLFVRRRSGGTAELFVTRILGDKEFVAMGNPLRKLKTGDIVYGEGDDSTFRIGERIGEREVRVRITSQQSLMSVLELHGHVPLPPYIKRSDDDLDRQRYQTIFAREEGSVAAPTAGLHFDTKLLGSLDKRGVRLCFVVLHVGLGTFMPLEREVVEENTLHTEQYSISGETLQTIYDAKADGRKVISVGTTVTRVLESVRNETFYERFDPSKTYHGETDLFIYPGHRFEVVDQLITNFHLPRSSLLVLVSAFLGVSRTPDCYEVAVREKYRFYSYGDAMFVR